MDIKDLIVFLEVAEEGNLSRAARKLNYVQSNVTMKIKQLEEELGTPLFYRNGKGVDVNTNGEILLPYAKQILQLVNEAVRSVQSNAERPMGTMKIGSTESTAAVRLPTILAQYCFAYPEVEVILETHTTDELIRLVVERKLEGAFVAGEAHHPDINSFLFHEEELTLISKDPLTSIHEVNGKNLLVFSHGCSYRKRLEAWLQEEKVVPNRILEFGTIEAIIGCVKAGIGTAVMMKEIIKENSSLAFTPLPETYSNIPTNFITRKDVLLSAALRKFLEFVKK
ncbi:MULTISPECIES: LysR family transcriptional regulator [Bacillus]|uniref:LysR family transcriptional regulator n=2 Tax=Bacillus TaxID=1386 RepID=A0A0M3R9D5_9BACI|nr:MULTISPECIES: LysR family transcriptional regulator [Bacillus]ALC81252.1 LysR family transcriptional regulator [Bacillus gobiensis]MBP1080253.1 DNA-binding transcriptional LysR family regulator [Bacillus capparidis]MED1094120.1 LysR family transcriptional regulator [Bacillus capparidis]